MYMNYTTNISIPKPLADLAKAQVTKGYYGSFSEVVRAALRQHLIHDDIPTYKMSKKAEAKAAQAMKEYKEGKTKKISSINDLL
jgi:putative addiction module CopG family antidote